MQGLAFATVSGIPLLYGLYIVWAPPFFYSLFGVSLHVSYGPFALVGLFIRDALGKRGFEPCDGLCRHDTEETRVRYSIRYVWCMAILCEAWWEGQGGFLSCLRPLSRSIAPWCVCRAVIRLDFLSGVPSSNLVLALHSYASDRQTSYAPTPGRCLSLVSSKMAQKTQLLSCSNRCALWLVFDRFDAPVQRR